MYSQQWMSFRRLNNQGIVLVLAIIPTMLIAVFGAKIHDGLAILGIFGVICEFGAAIYTLAKIRAFPCPRCKKPFTLRYSFGPNTSGRKCVHCDLRLNEELDLGKNIDNS